MVDLLQRVREAVVKRRHAEIEGLVRAAVDGGVDPAAIIDQGLIAAMDEVGPQFASGRIFVPELLVAAMTMKKGLEVVKPLLAGGESGTRGTVLLGTVKGDLHDIGKNIVGMMLEAAGFRVIDLGVDLSVEKVVAQVREVRPDLLGLSALLTTTLPEMDRVIRELEAQGLRDRVKVIVGGAPVDRTFAERIGADGYGDNAAEAVELARRLVGAAP